MLKVLNKNVPKEHVATVQSVASDNAPKEADTALAFMKGNGRMCVLYWKGEDFLRMKAFVKQ